MPATAAATALDYRTAVDSGVLVSLSLETTPVSLAAAAAFLVFVRDSMFTALNVYLEKFCDIPLGAVVDIRQGSLKVDIHVVFEADKDQDPVRNELKKAAAKGFAKWFLGIVFAAAGGGAAVQGASQPPDLTVIQCTEVVREQLFNMQATLNASIPDYAITCGMNEIILTPQSAPPPDASQTGDQGGGLSLKSNPGRYIF